MTDKQFCKIETALTGEPIDKVEQLVSTTMTGRELKEYLEDAFALYDVIKCDHENTKVDWDSLKDTGLDDKLTVWE